MANLRYFLIGKSGVGIWLVALLLAFVVTTFGNPFSDNATIEIEFIAEEILSFLISAALFSTIVYLLIKLVLFVLSYRDQSSQLQSANLPEAAQEHLKSDFIEQEFSQSPEKFDKTIIEIVGRVESLLEEDLEYMQKVHEMEAINQRYGVVGRKIKYRHQRFFVSSPLLEYSENIKIFSNTSYGLLDLNFGAWVHIKGEYVHAPETGQFYGRIHYVHEPVGFVRQISVVEARNLIENAES